MNGWALLLIVAAGVTVAVIYVAVRDFWYRQGWRDGRAAGYAHGQRAERQRARNIRRL